MNRLQPKLSLGDRVRVPGDQVGCQGSEVVRGAAQLDTELLQQSLHRVFALPITHALDHATDSPFRHALTTRVRSSADDYAAPELWPVRTQTWNSSAHRW
jgi:hypothetical protein